MQLIIYVAITKMNYESCYSVKAVVSIERAYGDNSKQ